MTVSIRPLTEADDAAAERVIRLAFGTMLGLPDPLKFRNGGELVAARRAACPDGAFAAEADGELVGIAIGSHWGSIGVFGPIAVHPQHWRGGVARALLDASMAAFDRWGNRIVGLFTFAERPVHVRLYQSYGFWSRSLTAIMARTVTTASPVPEALSLAAESTERDASIRQASAVTETICRGLDLGREIASILARNLGDVILLTEASRIVGLALVHHGRGSEAETGIAYVKFGCVAPGPQAARHFERLLAACNDFAHRRGAERLVAGVNMGCMTAYRLMIELGFRATMHGIAMHRPWIEAYDRPDVFALEDWR
jgi:GNAT superfamily N-acetyltransferase